MAACSNSGGNWRPAVSSGRNQTPAACICEGPKEPDPDDPSICRDRCEQPFVWSGTTCGCPDGQRQQGNTCVAEADPPCPDGSPRPASGECPPAADPDPNASPGRPPGATAETQPQPQAVAEYTLAQARQESRQYTDACLDAFKEARDCCGDPMQCLFGVSFGSQAEMNLLLNTVVGVGGQFLSAEAGGEDGKSISRACKIMETAGYTVAGLNGAAVAQCTAYQSTCSSVCKDHFEVIVDRGTFCGYNFEAGTTDDTNQRCERGVFRQLNEAYVALNDRNRGCDQFNSNIVQSGLAGIQAVHAAKMSEVCQKAAKGFEPADPGLDRKPTPIVGSSDCSNPANFNDPACSCSNPNFANTPRCRGQNPRGFGGPNSTSLAGGGTAFGGRGGFNTGELPVAASQLPPTQNIEAPQASNPGIQAGQGGGMGMGGDPGMMPAQAGGGQGGQAPGYNTDVLSRNAVGGGGYSTSPGPAFSSTGGFSGYGSGGAGGGARGLAAKKPGFNLKEFLPGGKKDPTRRMAGVGGTLVPEDQRRGASHQNIFDMVSERLRLYCQMKGLLEECPKKRSQNY